MEKITLYGTRLTPEEDAWLLEQRRLLREAYFEKKTKEKLTGSKLVSKRLMDSSIQDASGQE